MGTVAVNAVAESVAANPVAVQCTLYSTYMLVPVYADAAGVVDMCFCWFYVCR